MPTGDAVQTRPTLEEEMGKFKGFSTTDGEASDGQQTPKEAAVLRGNGEGGADAGTPPAADTPPAKRRSPLSEVLDPGGVDEVEEVDEGEGEGDEADAGAEGSEKDGSDEAEPPKKKGKGSLQERVNEVTRARREAERRANTAEQANLALERRLAALERGEKSLTPPADTPTSQAATEGAPDASKFEFGELDPQYVTALARHEAKQAIQAERSAEDKRRQDAAAERNVQEHVAKVSSFSEEGVKKYDDFDDVVMESAKAGEWDLTATVGELMLASEYGHDIAYHLATHPKEASALAAKSPAAQAAAFGRMEAKLEAAAASQAGTPPVKPSKAPPPVKTPRGPSGKYAGSAATQDFAAFEALAMAGKVQ